MSCRDILEGGPIDGLGFILTLEDLSLGCSDDRMLSPFAVALRKICWDSGVEVDWVDWQDYNFSSVVLAEMSTESGNVQTFLIQPKGPAVRFAKAFDSSDESDQDILEDFKNIVWKLKAYGIPKNKEGEYL